MHEEFSAEDERLTGVKPPREAEQVQIGDGGGVDMHEELRTKVIVEEKSWDEKRSVFGVAEIERRTMEEKKGVAARQGRDSIGESENPIEKESFVEELKESSSYVAHEKPHIRLEKTAAQLEAETAVKYATDEALKLREELEKIKNDELAAQRHREAAQSRVKEAESSRLAQLEAEEKARADAKRVTEEVKLLKKAKEDALAAKLRTEKEAQALEAKTKKILDDGGEDQHLTFLQVTKSSQMASSLGASSVDPPSDVGDANGQKVDAETTLGTSLIYNAFKFPFCLFDSDEDAKTKNQELTNLEIYYSSFLHATNCVKKRLKSVQHVKSILDRRHVLLWAIFQIYGDTHSGVNTKSIGLPQLVRLLKDAGFVTDSHTSTNGGVFAFRMADERIRMQRLSTPQLELEVKRLKKAWTSGRQRESSARHRYGQHSAPRQNVKLTKTGVPVNEVRNNRMAMSTELDFPQFYALIEQITPLIFTTISGPSKGAAGYIDSLFRDVVINKYNIQIEIEAGRLFMEQVGVSCSGYHCHAVDDQMRAIVAKDGETMKSIWQRNVYQLKLIYDYYSNAIEPSRAGRSVVRKLMSFEDVRQFLRDFGVTPTYCDLSTLQTLYRGCKLWEWSQAFEVMNEPSDSLNEEEAAVLVTAGNFGLSFFGLLEMLSRVAVRSKLDKKPSNALRSLLRVMDLSGGKQRLAEASRGSIMISTFHASNKDEALL